MIGDQIERHIRMKQQCFSLVGDSGEVATNLCQHGQNA